MNLAKRWIETWSALDWPEALEADQDLVLDLLDCLMREVAPLALEAQGLSERGRDLRSLGSIRLRDTFQAYRRAVEQAMAEGEEMGSPPIFLSSLAEALQSPARECLAAQGPAWRAVAQASRRSAATAMDPDGPRLGRMEPSDVLGARALCSPPGSRRSGHELTDCCTEPASGREVLQRGGEFRAQRDHGQEHLRDADLGDEPVPERAGALPGTPPARREHAPGQGGYTPAA